MISRDKAEDRFRAQTLNEPGHESIIEWRGGQLGGYPASSRTRYKVECTCGWKTWHGYWAVNKDGSISQSQQKSHNAHIIKARAEATEVSDDTVAPVKVGTAQGKRVTYETWVFHDQGPHPSPHATRYPSYPWRAFLKNSKGWRNLGIYSTQASAISACVTVLRRLELQGREITILTTGDMPTMREAVAALIKEADATPNIAQMKDLLVETEESMSALSLLQQRLRQELRDQFKLT